jgi:transposase
MLNWVVATPVFVALAPVDMRKGFNGLSAYVQSVLAQEVVGSGAVFVFTNQRRNRLKLLWWDGSGLIVCAKRLERGRFSWPQGSGAMTGLRPEQLTALITGLEVHDKRGWYRR